MLSLMMSKFIAGKNIFVYYVFIKSQFKYLSIDLFIFKMSKLMAL